MKRKNVWIIVGVVFWVGAVSFIVPARAIDMKEGKWELSMEMKMEGIPGVHAMSFTNTQCMTEKDLVPKSSEKDANCTILEQKITGNKVVWKAKCIEKGSVSEIEGEMSYSGTTSSGTQRIKMTEKNGPVMNATMKMKGRHIGNCN